MIHPMIVPTRVTAANFFAKRYIKLLLLKVQLTEI
jgi:hypothetical protein